MKSRRQWHVDQASVVGCMLRLVTHLNMGALCALMMWLLWVWLSPPTAAAPLRAGRSEIAASISPVGSPYTSQGRMHEHR